ncbi:MAG: hypothetical protein ACREUU_19170 [Gammaproteobacteria bacterium]
MEFHIDKPPPPLDEIDAEKIAIGRQMTHIRVRDNVITFVLIILTSVAIGFSVYWSTRSIQYAAIAASVFPILGAVLAVTGLISAVGFRSAARQMIELRHRLVALQPISEANRATIEELSGKYGEVASYLDKVIWVGRDLVNGELAIFWEWDASTKAKRERRRDFVDKARTSIQH